MKEIQLTQGKIALIDDEDFELLNQHKWCADQGLVTYYAGRQITIQSQNKAKNIKRKRTTIYMHRIILENKLKDNEDIHHINGNGLDNRKCNLQIVTRSQHHMTKKKRKNCSSQYKGIHWHKSHKKWQAQIMINYKRINLGYFNNEIEAAKAYDAKAKELFGEFARLNFEE